MFLLVLNNTFVRWSSDSLLTSLDSQPPALPSSRLTLGFLYAGPTNPMCQWSEVVSLKLLRPKSPQPSTPQKGQG